jgi:hypothetical protein
MTSLSQIDVGYRHGPKLAVPGDPVTLGAARLKWYALAPADAPPPVDLVDNAHRFLVTAQAELGLTDERGFVILHRCGADFYFLLVSVWRGSNELWEAVYFRDGNSTAFARFEPAYPAQSLRPTFCVWELGIVAFEAKAWAAFLASPREESDLEDWQTSHFAGVV